ncbi:hypothetical protein [Haladaptatus caseinilyticus]|uniref:hypothetical protein n=1 Tax=Haladaptatus caseinilyticus TaxID=2993314 RepID=UPI00224A9232|nr:hypothetical protein [Haladaptatus caseinilyticus]
MTVSDATYTDDDTLQISLTFGLDETPPLDELLTKGYVKLSVYDNDEFVENGTITLYNALHC